MSAAQGSRRQCMTRCLFSLPPRKPNALNLEVRGRAQGGCGFRNARLQRIDASLAVLEAFPRRELLHIPLAAILVVVIHPVIHDGSDLDMIY